MAVNYKICPKCGSKNAIRIVYGEPTLETCLQAEAGKVKLGGCCLRHWGPAYFCKDCEYEWGREEAIEAAYDKIKMIKASVGGFYGGYYDVEIDLENFKTVWSHWGGGHEEETVRKTIRRPTADKLKEQLRSMNLLNWKAKYEEPGVCDGTHWSLKIVTSAKTIRKHGNNKFPGEWEQFCKLMSETTKKRFS